MSLTSCLDEIKKVKPVAEEVVEDGNYQTLTARRGRQRAAVERMKQLKDEYARELGRSSMFVIAVGSLADDFVLACEPFAGFVNDPEYFYRDLASRISPALYEGKPTISNLFDVMGRHLEDKMRELGVLEYPQMIMSARYARTIQNASEFSDLVKEAVNEQIGAEVVGLQAANSSVERAIERDHAGSTTLMLLPTQDEKLVRSLMKDLPRLTPNVFVVIAGKATKGLRELPGAISIKNVSEESLENTLKAIKNLRK